MPAGTALVWFRRDLRDDDHAALHAALAAHAKVHCVFLFDADILARLPATANRRMAFLLGSVAELKSALEAQGGGLHILKGRAHEALPALARSLDASAVYANRDYEPAALARDTEVARALAAADIAFHTRKDQVIFEADEVRTQSGNAYSVFTPYKTAWLAKLTPFFVQAYPVGKYAGRLMPAARTAMPSIEELGFAPAGLAELGVVPGMSGARARFADFRRRIDAYRERRDYPAVKGPSYLSVHLRFGTISIRELVAYAWKHGSAGAQTWLSELAWRDFYFMILAVRPDVVERAFRREYDAVKFEFREDWWRAWCEGSTGYPLVDAAMRQMNSTGYMHNRLRMVSASFLVKHLGIDWCRGERYFGERLIDYDLAANNGGWQWAASTGCDAQPWFRIFNPVTQSQKFDTDGKFILRYVPELSGVPAKFIHAPWTMAPSEQEHAGCVIGRDYPAPVVDHAEARKKTLERFGVLKRPAG